MLSLAPSFDRRIWLLIDELASLHRLGSLHLLLSQGRKYGVCGVTAFQDIHQLRSIYGRDEAEALLSMYNTNLCYRTKCPDTALWMSRLTGQREIIEKREGFSYGANDIRDGVSVQQERRKEPLILDAEFLKLNDCEAYMLLPENTPVTKITLTAKQRPELSKVLIPRKSPKLSLTTMIKKPPATSKTDLEKEPKLKTLAKQPTKTKRSTKEQAELQF
jgi:type IV secretory pathway TraG/TraD family ATPase VirD4